MNQYFIIKPIKPIMYVINCVFVNFKKPVDEIAKLQHIIFVRETYFPHTFLGFLRLGIFNNWRNP